MFFSRRIPYLRHLKTINKIQSTRYTHTLWERLAKLRSWKYNNSTKLYNISKEYICDAKYIIKAINWIHTVFSFKFAGNYLVTRKIEFTKEFFIKTNKILSWFYPAGIYLLKVNNRNTRARCEIRSKLTIKIPERRQ